MTVYLHSIDAFVLVGIALAFVTAEVTTRVRRAYRSRVDR